jgi:hypothetical protein
MLSHQPDFLDRFVCKGGECRRTCCRHDWNVILSKDEYDAATSPDLPEDLSELARDFVVPNPRATGEEDFGMVTMVGDVRCPMLDDAGSCRWRARAGRHIGSTCSRFPVTALSFMGEEYLMPSGACEKVLELLLDREEPICMASSDREDAGDVYHEVIDEKRVQDRPLIGHYPEILAFGMRTLQDRSLRLDDRVAFLIEALACLDRLERTGQAGQTSALLDRLERRRADSVRSEEGGWNAPWAAVLVCGEVFSRYCARSAHAATARRILSGIGLEPVAVDRAESGSGCRPALRDRGAYAAARARIDPCLKCRERFFEHVSVCLFLKTLTPIRGDSVWDSAVYFAGAYALLKGGIAGYFACSGEPADDRALVDVIVEVLRMCTHSPLVRPTVCKALAAAHLDDVSMVKALVRS